MDFIFGGVLGDMIYAPYRFFDMYGFLAAPSSGDKPDGEYPETNQCHHRILNQGFAVCIKEHYQENVRNKNISIAGIPGVEIPIGKNYEEEFFKLFKAQ